MNVHELSRNQLVELKQTYLDEQNRAKGQGTYWSELADADEIISDEEIYEKYKNYDFSPDDFFSSQE